MHWTTFYGFTVPKSEGPLVGAEMSCYFLSFFPFLLHSVVQQNDNSKQRHDSGHLLREIRSANAWKILHVSPYRSNLKHLYINIARLEYITIYHLLGI